MLTVTYKSNMSNCVLLMNPVGTQPFGLVSLTRTGGDSDGTQSYSGNGVGAVQFTFFCDGANGNSPVINATPQTVTVQQGITASVSAPANAVTGTAFTLSWQTTGATSCSASGGGADGTSWTGNVSLPSGQKNITPTVTGNFTYMLTCIGPSPSDTLSAQATISVTAAVSPPPPAGGSSSGGGGGGGGAFDGLALGILALAKILGGYRRRWITQGSWPGNQAGKHSSSYGTPLVALREVPHFVLISQAEAHESPPRPCAAPGRVLPMAYSSDARVPGTKRHTS
jgi:hypothetical protein